jgi:hypothetical protein
VEGSLLAPALAETAARGAARARERDSAIASLSLPLCGFRSDRLRTDGQDRDSSEPLSAGFALRGPFAKWSAHNLRTGDPSGQAGPRIFFIFNLSQFCKIIWSGTNFCNIWRRDPRR